MNKNIFSEAVKIILFLLSLLFLYFIRDIILIFIVSLIIAAIFNPLVDWLEKKKISRGAATILIYFIFLFLLVGLLILIVPSLTKDLEFLGTKISSYYSILRSLFGRAQEILPKDLSLFSSWQTGLSSLTRGVFSLLGDVANAILAIFLILIISFYLVVEKEAIAKFFLSFIPEKRHQFVSRLISLSQKNLSNWGWGMLILMLFIGVLTYLGLLILEVRYALFFAIIAGLTEVIPRIGPFLGAVPAVVLTFFQAPIKAIFVALLYFLIQQIEGSIVVPQVMKKAVGLNPIVVILVLLIGAKIGGILGAIIAVPVTAVIDIVIREYRELKKQESNLVHY
ncbi:MAG: AI-2E family transporter [Patescibacteria group bacterium]|nr:AI-2E family transporter [Patescibacteria group bacterium]